VNGACYISSEGGNENFEKFAFIRVGKESENEDFCKGLTNLHLQLKRYSKLPRARIVIAVDKMLGDFTSIYEKGTELLEGVTDIEGMEFNTNDPKYFKECGVGFLSFFDSLVSRHMFDH
jgi:hypothetical protein